MHLNRFYNNGYVFKIFILMLLVLVVFGVNDTMAVSSADRADPVDVALGVADGGESLQNIFGGTPGRPEVKNLYLNIYSSLKTRPSSDALRNTAAQYQYTESDMWSILNGDFFTLRRTRVDLKTSDDILEELGRIQDTYQDELSKQELKSQLFADTYPQEIFVNGETGDSGFDVVYDLEILELLLFGDDQLTPIGGETGLPGELPVSSDESESLAGPSSPVSPSSASSSASPEEDIDSNETPDDISDEEDDNPIENPDDSEGDVDDGPTPTGPTDDSADDNHPSGGQNPSCTTNNAIQNIFKNAFFAEEKPKNLRPGEHIKPPESKPESTTLNGDNEISTKNFASTSSRDNSNTNDPSTFYNPDGTVKSNYTPAPAHEWPDAPKICNKIFCLKVRFTNRPDPQYEPAKNCIQCHVQYIVERLRATASTGLTPGKVSGNFMEPAMCKKSLFNSGISLNFIPIAMPIKTPGVSRLITGVDLSKEFEAFIKRTLGAEPEKNFEERLEQKVRYESTIGTPGRTSDDIFKKALSAYEDELDEIAESAKRSYFYSSFNGSTDFYQSMRYELDQMTVFFESYKSAISMAQEVVEERKNNLTPAE